MEEIVKELILYGILQFGEFVYKSGKTGNNYFDMRRLVGCPYLQERVYDLIYQKMNISNQSKSFKICGVPTGGTLIASALSQKYKIPFIVLRSERKDHGTMRLVEGPITFGESIILLEDVMTTGGSVIDAINKLAEERLYVSKVVVFLDRRQTKSQFLNANGTDVLVQSVLTLNELQNIISRIQPIPYELRLNNSKNNIAASLLRVMIKKQTNLMVAADVTSSNQLLALAEQVGPYVCAIKTHVDIIRDYTLKTMQELRGIARQKNFLIIEDRKFADIGNTVREQYTGGIHKISQFADIVIAHSLFGKGTLDGLDTNVILLAESSSNGNFIDAEYTKKTVALGKESPKVIGFICQKKIADNSFLHFTPGINSVNKVDALGQTYQTPRDAIVGAFTDIIIVGRGIYAAEDPIQAARQYQKAGWEAYLEATQLSSKLQN